MSINLSKTLPAILLRSYTSYLNPITDLALVRNRSVSLPSELGNAPMHLDRLLPLLQLLVVVFGEHGLCYYVVFLIMGWGVLALELFFVTSLLLIKNKIFVVLHHGASSGHAGLESRDLSGDVYQVLYKGLVHGILKF